MRLGAIAMWTHGRLLGGSAELEQAEITGVTIDTRKLRPGDLFVAIKGERVDGHDYLDEALARGAVAALVARQVDSTLPQLLVDHVELALGDLASAVRAAQRARGRHHRLQRQDHGEDPGRLDPVAPRPYPRQCRQLQQ